MAVQLPTQTEAGQSDFGGIVPLISEGSMDAKEHTEATSSQRANFMCVFPCVRLRELYYFTTGL